MRTKLRQTGFCQSKYGNKYQWQFFGWKRQTTFTVFMGIRIKQNYHDSYLGMVNEMEGQFNSIHCCHPTIINKPQTSFGWKFMLESMRQGPANK